MVDTELFDTTTCNFSYNQDYSQLNGWSMFGVKFSSAITNFNKLVIKVSKKNESGGFTGNMTLEIRDTDGTTVLVTGTSVNVSTLSDMPTYDEITFTCATTTVSAGQYICVTFPAGTNSTNCLFWYRSNTANDCSDPTVTGIYYTTTNNSTDLLADMQGWYVPTPTPGASGTRDPPPPFNLVSF